MGLALSKAYTSEKEGVSINRPGGTLPDFRVHLLTLAFQLAFPHLRTLARRVMWESNKDADAFLQSQIIHLLSLT